MMSAHRPLQDSPCPECRALWAHDERIRIEERDRFREVIKRLERLNLITTNPERAEKCCGLPRDSDGQCIHRPGHPVYVELRS
jgi:hypothetical protein